MWIFSLFLAVFPWLLLAAPGIYWDITTTEACERIEGWCSEDYCQISPMEAGRCDGGEFCCASYYRK